MISSLFIFLTRICHSRSEDLTIARLSAQRCRGRLTLDSRVIGVICQRKDEHSALMAEDTTEKVGGNSTLHSSAVRVQRFPFVQSAHDDSTWPWSHQVEQIMLTLHCCPPVSRSINKLSTREAIACREKRPFFYNFSNFSP